MTRELKILLAIVALTFVGGYVWRDAIIVDTSGNSLSTYSQCDACGSKQINSVGTADGVTVQCLRCKKVLCEYRTTR